MSLAHAPRRSPLYALDERFLAPPLAAAVRSSSEERLRAVVREELPGVISFDLFTPAFCADLLGELAHIEHRAVQRGARLKRPNSMNAYGVVLDDVGFEDMLDALMLDYLAPLARLFFPALGGGTLDHHHGFVVEYALDKDHDLGLHIDDSEVTLNACLGREFEGGALSFAGVRCGEHLATPVKTGEAVVVEHVPGRAILHAGRHRHAARPIAGGERVNLILWCKSSRHRRSPAKDACASGCGA